MNKSFLSDEEVALSESFLESGYIIATVNDLEKLTNIRNSIVELTCKHLNRDLPKDESEFLNNIHGQVDVESLNDLRLSVFKGFNAISDARRNYFALAEKELSVLVGNELAMQRRINLSIQLPQDSSSLLPVHSDVWSGDSPFEVVLWLPLVDCYQTKSMFLLPPEPNEHFSKEMHKTKSSEELFRLIEPELLWLEVPFGSFLLFSQTLMHGNRVNEERETRWSMNCRLKSLFSPYSSKRLGEFFEPINIRAATHVGMNYQLPGGFDEE